MAEPQDTNNIPAMWQQIVLDSIKAAQERREQLIAEGKIMSDDDVLKEIYTQIAMRGAASGEKEFEAFPAYFANAMRRVVRWAVKYSASHPPTHRKGYGKAGKEVVSLPGSLIFKFGGGGHGGPPPGSGDPDFPEPEEWEWDEDDFGGGFYTIDPPSAMVNFFHSRWGEMDIPGQTHRLSQHGASEDEYRDLQAGALFHIAREWRAQGNDYLYLYPKAGGTNYQGKSEDILLIRDDGNIYWKDVGISFGSHAARLDFGPFRISGEPDKFVEP